jgi:hypothetical protein
VKSNQFNRIVLISALSVLLCGSAHAGFALSQTEWERPSAAPVEGSFAGIDLTVPERVYPLSLKSVAAAPFASTAEPSGGTLDLALWQFIRSVKFQQSGNSFALLDSNLRIFEGVAAPQAAAVPLPGTAWLLATGVMGLVGVKMQGRGRRPNQAARLTTGLATA